MGANHSHVSGEKSKDNLTQCRLYKLFMKYCLTSRLKFGERALSLD